MTMTGSAMASHRPHQFKPGQSGNPRGRARADEFKQWENPLQKYMLEPIEVTSRAKETVPVVDALIKGAINRALGDVPST